MNKESQAYIWATAAAILVIFSIWFIKNPTAAMVINLFASCLMADQFIFFSRQSRGKTWRYMAMVACFVNALIDLHRLSF